MARKCEKAADESSRPARAIKSALQQLRRALLAARDPALRKRDATRNDGKHIVEVVSDASRQLPDSLHLLHLPDLLLGSFAVGNRAAQLGIRPGEFCGGAPGAEDPSAKRIHEPKQAQSQNQRGALARLSRMRAPDLNEPFLFSQHLREKFVQLSCAFQTLLTEELVPSLFELAFLPEDNGAISVG